MKMNFWIELNQCFKEFKEGKNVIVVKDMNAEVSNEGIYEAVGKWGVPWGE